MTPLLVLLIAGVCVGVHRSGLLGDPGPFFSFDLAFLATALLGSYMAGLARVRHAATLWPDLAFAAMLVLPAVGTGLWLRTIALADGQYLDPLIAFHQTFGMAAEVGTAGGPLLVAAGLVLCTEAILRSDGKGPRRRWLILLAGILILEGSLAWGAGWPLARVAKDWKGGNVETAISMVPIVSWAWLPGVVLVLAATFGIRIHPTQSRSWLPGAWGAMIMGVAAWAVTPPATALMENLPRPEVAGSTPIPVGNPGRPVALCPIDPLQVDLEEILAARGHVREKRLTWTSFDPAGNWTRTQRAHEVLQVSQDLSMERLEPWARVLDRHSVGRMALLGRAAPRFGPVGRLVGWPAATFLLEVADAIAPIQGGPSLWILLRAEGPLGTWDVENDLWAWTRADRLPRLPPRSGCLVVVEPDVTVGSLYALGRILGDPGGVCPDATGLAFPGRDRPLALQFVGRMTSVPLPPG